MAANRYGQIWHGDHHHINIRFPSNEARLKFQNEFQAHHASHDHEGEVPTFKLVNRSDLKLGTGDRDPEDLVKAETDKDYRITIDGYGWSDIHKYHNPKDSFSRYFHYKVPTCCVPPTIVVDREFVDSGTLKRHELSAVFQDMPDDEFLALIESIATKGIIDNVIKVHEGKILDGWHRYRACQELNILRKLRFQVWDIEKDGDPVDFVSAKNLDRRRHTQSQVAQILLHLAERYGHGGNRGKSSQETLKSLEEIAKKGNLSVSTMKRASAVQKLGDDKVQAVMEGQIAATKVLKEAKQRESACKRNLVEILKTEGMLNVETANMHELAEKHDLKPAAVQKLRDQVWDTEIVKARDRWQKSYTKVRTAWFDNEVLSNSVEWKTFTAATIEQVDMASLSLETFTEADSRIKSCTDYQLLQNEADCLITLGYHLRNPSTWVSNLIPKAETGEAPLDEMKTCVKTARRAFWNARDVDAQLMEIENTDFAKAAIQSLGLPEASIAYLFGRVDDWDMPISELASWTSRFRILSIAVERKSGWVQTLLDSETKLGCVSTAEMDALWAAFNKRYPKWKAKYAESGYQENALIQASIEAEMLDALRIYRKSDRTGMPTPEEVKDMTRLMDQQSYPFARCLRDMLKAKVKTVSEDTLELRQAQEHAEERRQRMWSYFVSEIQVKHGKTLSEVSEEDFAKAAADFLGLSTIRVSKENSVGLGLEYCFTADEFILGDIENPPYALSDCTLADAAMWASRFDVISIALMNMADWVQALLDEPDYELKQREHVNRLESLPGEIRQLLPTWQQAHGIEGTLTLKLLLNARQHIEFGRERGPDPFFREEMEDLLKRMKSNDKDLIEKVRELIQGSEPEQEQGDWETQHEHTLVAIERLKTGLKKAHVIDSEAFADDILQFYNGVDLSELSTSPQETLKNISDFIEGFVDEPLQAWPEYIRNHRWMPKRELVLVSIGINNNTDDEFELVEFTDESSDEIRCDLNALPEDLRTALLKIASEKIYAEAVKEFHTDG